MNDQAVAREQAGAWERSRSREDAQVAWVSSKRLLQAALEGDLDRQLLERFGRRVRQLADEVAEHEASLQRSWGSRLPFMVAMWVAHEVLMERHEDERAGELIDAFANVETLAWEDVER